MKLAEMTWPEVAALDREMVVVIPTGSLEQHGAHLPLFTDSILATSVAEAVEAQCVGEMLLVPSVWLGCSGHHLAFDGSLSNSFDGYDEVLVRIINNMIDAGFHKFYLVNGHGGNTSSNDLVCRRIKMDHEGVMIGHVGYFQFIDQNLLNSTMEGRVKGIRHACEAETSLMMHVRPDLVRSDKLRDDGLHAEPPVLGMVWHFDEITEAGSLGQATLASAEKGKSFFDSAVNGVVGAIKALFSGVVLIEDQD